MKRALFWIVVGVLCLVGIGFVVLFVWLLWRSFRRWPWGIGAVLAGLAIVAASTGLYYSRTVEADAVRQSVETVDSRFYVEQGWFSQVRYMQYYALPTRFTKPGEVYRVVVDNGMASWSDEVVWSRLELDIGKPKLVKREITEDEYQALSLVPWYAKAVYEVRPERNITYLFLPPIYLGVVALVVMARREKRGTRHGKGVVLYSVR